MTDTEIADAYLANGVPAAHYLALCNPLLAAGRSIAYQARREAAVPVERLLDDLQVAAATLRRYEALHRAKGTPESTTKAEVNANLAARFEATIREVGRR